MKAQFQIATIMISAALLINSLPFVASAAVKKDQAAIVAAELGAIANQLALRPETAIDLSDISGEYCFNVGLKEGAHMTHYAIDPTKTQEDVIDFVNAEALIKAGVKVESLPRFPEKLGSMTPNQWYYLPAGELEPHHGIRFPFPILLRASDLK